jgi:hypothetical protein
MKINIYLKDLFESILLFLHLDVHCKYTFFKIFNNIFDLKKWKV